MKRALAIALVAVCFWQNPARADLIPGSRSTVGGWSLSAHDRAGGKFSHCAISAPYKSGIRMLFSVSGNQSWRVGWTHESWRFTKGQSVDLTLLVDNAGPFPLKAVAATENLALAELPAKEELFDVMRKGTRMTVRAMGNTYAFNLDGTYAALTEVLNCTARYGGGSGTPPGTSASAATSPPAPPAPAPPLMPPQPSASAPPPPPQARPTSAPNVADRSGKTNMIRLILGDGTESKPQEVFEKASGAVYIVKAEKSLGSAIAIGERDLLTNCHVVEGATTVTLEREGLRFPATVVSANANADRCVLRIGATAPPLPKWVRVRPYADVKVGERVFTIGTPRGLELTLAEGIISSKRVKEGERLLQTSAPISRGSSGGGLFDAQGNLIGITTFMIRDAQNINFAIAAEEYAR
ncbi:S1C family serine protease [Reyranella sp.]|uniref:S1C family serine protease n=1 Tax=Reyranella sp. TaxID=1929291 RepID=UPI003F7188D7